MNDEVSIKIASPFEWHWSVSTCILVGGACIYLTEFLRLNMLASVLGGVFTLAAISLESWFDDLDIREQSGKRLTSEKSLKRGGEIPWSWPPIAVFYACGVGLAISHTILTAHEFGYPSGAGAICGLYGLWGVVSIHRFVEYFFPVISDNVAGLVVLIFGGVIAVSVFLLAGLYFGYFGLFSSLFGTACFVVLAWYRSRGEES